MPGAYDRSPLAAIPGSAPGAPGDPAGEVEEVERQGRRAQQRRHAQSLREGEQVLPRRFTLRGEAQVFPVTIEIRFPEVGV